MQALAGNTEFALTSVLGQSERIMDFTNNAELIGAGIQKIGRRGNSGRAHQLLEAISNQGRLGRHRRTWQAFRPDCGAHRI